MTHYMLLINDSDGDFSRDEVLQSVCHGFGRIKTTG